MPVVRAPRSTRYIAGMNTLPPGDTLCTMTVDARERRYLVHVPPSYDPGRPLPLVLSFHGSNSNGQTQLEFTDMNPLADREEFLLVYPFGTGDRERMLFWNAGNCCSDAKARQGDDVAFIRALLDQLCSRLSIDLRRIYATGMSNGGMFAYRLANEMADVFAAIAPVAGVMGFEIARPSRPISVLHFHGSADEFVPIEGGVGRRSVTHTSHYSLAHTIRQWVSANHCPTEPDVTTLNYASDDGTQTVRTVYGPGDSGAEVVLYLIHGAGHIWPGRPPRPHYLGKTTYNLSANELIWEFFQKHGRAGDES